MKMMIFFVSINYKCSINTWVVSRTMNRVIYFLCFMWHVGAASMHATLKCDDVSCIMSNGYVEMTLSISGGAWVSSLKGDFQGEGNFGENLLSEGGLRLEREDDAGVLHSSAGLGSKSTFITSDLDDCVNLKVPSVYDDIIDPYSSESWNFELCQNQRYVSFSSKGAIMASAETSTAKSVRHTMYMTPVSTVGFFDRGVVQMMSAASERSYFGSSDSLKRLYVLGQTGSVDIQRLVNNSRNQISVMMSAADNVQNKIDFRSGFQEVLAGEYDASQLDLWTEGWASQKGGHVLGSVSWERAMTITPNNHDFPASTLPADVNNMDNNATGDLGAFMTGIYSNGVGNLCTFDNEVTRGLRVAQIATTLRVDNSEYSIVYFHSVAFIPHSCLCLSRSWL